MTDLFEENFGMNADEMLKWQVEAMRNLAAESGKATRSNLSKKFPDTAIRSAEALRSNFSLFSETGLASAMLSPQLLQGKGADELFEGTLEMLYTNPVFLNDRALWVLVQVLLRSQQQFTTKACSAPTKEETLTGELLGAITSHASFWAEKGQRLLQGANAKLQIGRIELQLNRREGVTGGDFGLIVEYERNGKIFYLPLIFQAKRYEGTTADVSQFHDTRGYQYTVLNNQRCTAAYLFYHNGKSKITDNIPPLAKFVQDTLHPGTRTHTSVEENTFDFFSFVMKAIAGGSDFHTADDEKSALSMIISTAPFDELVAIVALGRSEETQARYESAFASVVADHDHENEAGYEEPGTNNEKRPKLF